MSALGFFCGLVWVYSPNVDWIGSDANFIRPRERELDEFRDEREAVSELSSLWNDQTAWDHGEGWHGKSLSMGVALASLGSERANTRSGFGAKQRVDCRGNRNSFGAYECEVMRSDRDMRRFAFL